MLIARAIGLAMISTEVISANAQIAAIVPVLRPDPVNALSWNMAFRMMLMLRRVDATLLDPAADVVAHALDDGLPRRIDDLVAARLCTPKAQRRQRQERGLAGRMSHDVLPREFLGA